MTYRDAAALSANYARVFTPEVKAAVAAANADICSPATRAS